MNKIQLFFLICLALVASASCVSLTGNSGGRTTVEGQVVERTSGQPVPDAWVQLYKPGKGMSSGYSKEGDPHRADANGRFSFSYDAEDESSYLLMADSEKGHYTVWQEAPNLSSGKKNKDVKVKVYAPAWVKIKLTDEPPKSKVWIYTSGYLNPDDYLTLPTDTFLIRQVNANTAHGIVCRITKENGSEERTVNSINSLPFDTTTLEIKF